jgi:general secretion pathway protein L
VADQLFLRLSADGGEASMVLLDAEARLLAGPEAVTLDAVASRARGAPVTVMLPAPDIVSRVARLPAASPSRLRQLLPYTLEDDFAGDVDDLHFASGERNDKDLLAVAVIAREQLNAWLDRLRTAGIEPQRICSEADAVPDPPGVLTLFLERARILGRRPGGAPFAFVDFGLGELWQLLESERDDDSDLRRVVLFVDAETRRERAAEIEDWRGVVDELDIKELADGCLPRQAANLVHRPGINLLQGDYGRRSDAAALVRPWRTAAGLLVGLGLLALLGKLAIVVKLGSDAELLLEEITAICAQSYSTPQENGCRLEMLRRFDRSGQTAATSGSGYLQTQSVIAEAGGNALSIQAMTYRSGVLTLDFLAPSVPFVETFAQAIAGSGRYQVRDQTTTAEADGVKARMSIVTQIR